MNRGGVMQYGQLSCLSPSGPEVDYLHSQYFLEMKFRNSSWAEILDSSSQARENVNSARKKL